MNQNEQQHIDKFIKDDKSYMGRSFLESMMIPKGAREGYEMGLRIGFEQGLHFAKPEGRILQLSTNIRNKNDKMFFDKFLDICKEHNIKITYHPQYGLVFEELTPIRPCTDTVEEFCSCKDPRTGSWICGKCGKPFAEVYKATEPLK